MQDQITNSIKNNIWAKIGIILVISALLMIPTAQIEGLINERNNYSLVAKRDIAQKWSGKQAVGALSLTIPATYMSKETDSQGKVIFSEETTDLHFLPKNLNINAETKTTPRQRGIYSVPLYESKITLKGSFSGVSKKISDLKKLKLNWEQAKLSMGVTDMRGLKAVTTKWNKRTLQSEAGSMPSSLMTNALNSAITTDDRLRKEGKADFLIEIELRGSGYLSFYPTGQNTTVSMASDWNSPSFQGSFLPETREITETGFHAKWNVLGLTRNIPKHWVGSQKVHLDTYQFGVALHQSLQNYQLNTRTAKYSLLFILLTFVTLFFLEILFKQRFHPMHYTMIGASLVLFYLILLSFSEHVGFSFAYAIASFSTVITNSFYTYAITKVKKTALLVFAQISALYGFLFVLLKQEDFTLVFGASGLWIILIVLMVVTRKIDWFQINQTSREAC